MMKKIYLFCSVLAVIAGVVSCREAYSPPETNNNINWLVVEGTINTGGGDSTFITLSRTVKLTAATTLKPELNATVTIESNTGDNYLLGHKARGVYYMPALPLDPTKRYRLRIRTNDARNYLSDFVEVKQTPQIDNITWKADDEVLKIYADTHDPSGNARYYRWDFDETYEFRSFLPSLFMSDGVKIVPRDAANNISICWKNLKSDHINLASTAKLSQDVVDKALITTISSANEKVSYKYSILLKQYALTKDAFEFWERLKKNTEQLGSIFDAQPSMLTSNIRNLNNPNEPVIGYLSACNVTTKRIYISVDDLPRVYRIPRYQCEADTFRFRNADGDNEVLLQLVPKASIPSTEYRSNSGALLGYFGKAGNCIDCTLRGSNKKPSFWP